MIKNIWQWVLQLFGVQTATKTKEIEKNDEYVENYKKIEDINFTAIFSNKLANYTVNDSTIDIEGNNRRAEFLTDTMVPIWKKIKKPIDMAYGLGAVALVPYIKDDKIYYKIVEQNRITIDNMDGELITGATILSERKDVTYLSRTDSYLRWTNYKIENGNLRIKHEYTNEKGSSISKPEFWENIIDEQIIHNVDRVLFGFIKCPRNNRSTSDKFGVPITYGAEATIKELKDTLKQINREFELKQAFIGADIKMFKDGRLPQNGLYKIFKAEGKDGMPFWEIFDPAIRESSYFVRLEELYSRLEKEVGTSDGILTKRKSNNATATEIKASRYDTFTIIDDMRSNIENGIYDFLKACDVLANANNLTPMGDWELNFNWDYGLIESSEDTFNQLTIGIDKGVVKKEELRRFINPTETIEEAEGAIKEIEEKRPDIKSLLGV